MEAVLALLGVGLLLLLAFRGQRGGQPTPTPTPTPVSPPGDSRTSELERIRASYEADLRRRGWAGSHLPGNTVAEIGTNYQREWAKLVGLDPSRIQTPPPGISDLERIRWSYMNDLRLRGWTGATLPGNTVAEIQTNYQREYAKLTGQDASRIIPVPPGTSDLGRIRLSYVNDLRVRGWPGATLPGNTPDEIYASYLREYEKLTRPPAPTPTPTPTPTPAPSRKPKYQRGDLVRVPTIGQPIEHIANFTYDAGQDTYLYWTEEHPQKLWQEFWLQPASFAEVF